LEFSEGIAVELVRAEIEIVNASRLELRSGAVRVRHPGGDARPLEVGVSEARGTARLEGGTFRVGRVAPAGISVANQNGQAEIDVPAGVVPVRSGTEVVYEAGKEPISRPIPASHGD
jgi:ferric-dicitrate binding protein FerR (iron transport regulator)